MHKNSDFMFGDASLHIQLSTALAVMTQLIVNPSKPPSAATLSDELKLSVRHLRKLLRTLAVGGLVKAHDKVPDTWLCVDPPHTISLGDIYQCLISSKEEAASPFISSPQISSSDLLMMQATVSINQMVLQQLQRFDLGRLKVAESAISYTTSIKERAGRQMASAESVFS